MGKGGKSKDKKKASSAKGKAKGGQGKGGKNKDKEKPPKATSKNSMQELVRNLKEELAVTTSNLRDARALLAHEREEFERGRQERRGRKELQARLHPAALKSKRQRQRSDTSDVREPPKGPTDSEATSTPEK